MTSTIRVLTVADSDSYIKWGAALTSRMPQEWTSSLVVLANPVLPSDSQLEAAVLGTPFTAPPVVRLPGLRLLLKELRPDVVLISVRGPLVKVIVRTIRNAMEERPVIMTGLPGISIPATRMAVAHRAQADLFVLHSHREVREFTNLARRMRIDQRFVLATLPFLPHPNPEDRTDGDVIFASQATVPAAKGDRIMVLNALAESARRHPYRRVVIKLRATGTEQQTHAEAHSYETLMDELEGPIPRNLVIANGAMGHYLTSAAALVTISSTAAIEAIALNVPALILDDFGVSKSLINTVFEGSGLFGSRMDLVRGEFHLANLSWLSDNYFHDDSENSWIATIESLVAQRNSSALPLKSLKYGKVGGRLRESWDRKRALGSFDHSLSGHVALLIGTLPRLILLGYRNARKRSGHPLLPLDSVQTPVGHGVRRSF